MVFCGAGKMQTQNVIQRKKEKKSKKWKLQITEKPAAAAGGDSSLGNCDRMCGGTESRRKGNNHRFQTNLFTDNDENKSLLRAAQLALFIYGAMEIYHSIWAKNGN